MNEQELERKLQKVLTDQETRHTSKSRFFFINIILLLICVGCVFFLYRFIAGDTEEVPTLVQEDPVSEVSGDKDGDGLFDWQEDLYGTSKTLKDTDGDGVSDFEEVQRGHDPVYFGEGFSDETQVVAPQREIYEEFEFTYEDPSDPFEALVRLQQIEGNTQESGIDPDTAVLRDEINILGTIMGSVVTKESQNVEIFSRLFLQEEINQAPIQGVIETYKQASLLLQQTHVSRVGLEKASLQQGLEQVAESLQLLLDARAGDSTLYIEHLQTYSQSVIGLQQSVLRFKDVIDAHSVSFDSDEPGSFFTLSL